jgi:hypothetical protein
MSGEHLPVLVIHKKRVQELALAQVMCLCHQLVHVEYQPALVIQQKIVPVVQALVLQIHLLPQAQFVVHAFVM